jgi:hypothetical protein
MILFKQLCVSFFLTTSYYVALTQPPGKHWEAAAYNETTNELAIFSGAELKDTKWFVTDSLWLFNGKWRFVDGNGITGRWAHGLVYHNNALYTYGGLINNAQGKEEVVNYLYRFKDSWSKVTDGPKLSLPTLFSLRGKLLLTGQSYEDKKSFEVWELVGTTFQKHSSTHLGIERDRLWSLLVKNDFVVVFASDSGLVFLNITNGHTTIVKDLPNRSKFGITYNSNLDSYFLFGGLDEKNNFTNELWQIKNGLSEKIHGGSPPSPRAANSMLPTANGFILYGGAENGGKLSNEVWRYETGKWIQGKY